MPLPTEKVIAGMDEAGRGPWAGPLVAAAVILPARLRLPNLNDSKQLSAHQREMLYELITQKAEWGVGIATHQEIDDHGLMVALNRAYVRALEALVTKPDLLMIDGRDRLQLPAPSISVIRGDEKVRCISAASIVAKVTRDRLMVEMDTLYPDYAFESHKGYGTRKHSEALKKYGVTPIHRLSYKPVQAYL